MSGYRPDGLEDAFTTGIGDQAHEAAASVDPGAAPSSTAPGAGPDGGLEPTDAAGGGTVEPHVAARDTTDDLASPDPGMTQDVQVPRIGVVGWLRWIWRQLSSMRVALMLLMLLAVASVPGTIFPQHAQDPAKVATYLTDHPALGPWLERLQLFDVYSSVWFSAIYLLLFISLIACIVPRTRVHLTALRARPPRVPRRFDRFPAQGGLTTTATPQEVAEAAAAALRGPWRLLPRFRVDVAVDGDDATVSAERGYLRETGNLVFHLSLIGLLIAIAVGQMLHYRGQALVVQGHGFANAVVDYDTFERGTAFNPSSLVPFTLRLDSFSARFSPTSLQPRDFTADVTVTQPDGSASAQQIKVNHPLNVAGANIYLQGNGYAPDVVVRDAAGNVAFSGPVPFLPQNAVYTSLGVIKVPDVTSGDQIGFRAALLPTAQQDTDGVWQSVAPQPVNPLLVLTVWTGNLGLDTGVPQNVYKLDTSHLKQVMGADGQAVSLKVQPGETVDLPNGLGTLTFKALPRYVALDLRYDPALAEVLVFALLALAGLATSLFTPRRRIWLRASAAGEGRTVVTAAALARGDDIGLQPELDRVLTVVGKGLGIAEDDTTRDVAVGDDADAVRNARTAHENEHPEEDR
jgi:cytochrome c biogenesis protein